MKKRFLKIFAKLFINELQPTESTLTVVGFNTKTGIRYSITLFLTLVLVGR